MNTPSAFAGDSNGERIDGSVYSDDEPYNWHGVTWTAYTEGTDTVYHVTEIDWYTSGSYYQVDGNLNLSNFPYLTSFKLDYAQVDGLDVTGDTALTTLVCTRTKMTDPDGTVTHTGITSLDLSTNTNLSYVDVGINSITALNTSAAGTHLTQLHCEDNALTSLNVSGNTSLTALDCSRNKLTGTLNVTNFTALGVLDCTDNGLTGLKVDGCAAIYDLECGSNDITGVLDATDCVNVKTLQCDGNKLTGVDVSGLSKLDFLDCSENQIALLDVSDNAAMTLLYCGSNQLSALDITSNTALVSLECSNNDLTALNVSQNTALKTLYCGNNQITALSTAANAELNTLDCSGNALTALNVSVNPKMQILRCYDNALGSLSVSANAALTDLDCSNCGLSALDVHANAELDNLNCSHNPLGSLDISHNAKLSSLDCGGCGLSALDISGTEIALLICDDNNLSSLDLSGFTGFFLLDLSGNHFTDLDLSALYCFIMDCTDNPLTHLKALLTFGYTPGDTKPVELTASGEGYVGLYANLFFEDAKFNKHVYSGGAFASGTPKSVGGAFYNWTDAADAVVATTAKYTLEADTAYNLTAHFFTLTASPADGKIYTGGRITLTPSVAGGEWSFDTSLLSRSGNEFTGLKAGTAHVVYMLGGSAATSFDVVVQASNLPDTGQDMAWVWALVGAALILGAAGMLTRRRLSARTR